MNASTKVPPIKSQGIKTKLVPWIRHLASARRFERWVEPFMGTGVVAFNVMPKHALLCDSNPHLINFYSSIAKGEITSPIAKEYLQKEGALLLKHGEDHYYMVRERFNSTHSPLDFLFLNRAGFNGMIRFNRHGNFNIPFCRKPSRFSQSYITKVINQIDWVEKLTHTLDFEFRCQDFSQTIAEASRKDLIYCDPPYIARHVDYFNSWTVESEHRLHSSLVDFSGDFLLSTWHHNDFRVNTYVQELWHDYNISTQEHFYHIGGLEKNRNPVVEAIVSNFLPPITAHTESKLPVQYLLCESPAPYS